jgi:hypothetical protein
MSAVVASLYSLPAVAGGVFARLQLVTQDHVATRRGHLMKDMELVGNDFSPIGNACLIHDEINRFRIRPFFQDTAFFEHDPAKISADE